uniref:Uncharacterized protein n=1 Tax=Myoviridae sp. ctIty1 TaxID=2827673 RepID=A0A8S5THF5_9CAUD|nr:MAG TPA: hypothetical protein [Myoviridae sp. ctIty1]
MNVSYSYFMHLRKKNKEGGKGPSLFFYIINFIHYKEK